MKNLFFYLTLFVLICFTSNKLLAQGGIKCKNVTLTATQRGDKNGSVLYAYNNSSYSKKIQFKIRVKSSNGNWRFLQTGYGNQRRDYISRVYTVRSGHSKLTSNCIIYDYDYFDDWLWGEWQWYIIKCD